MQFFKMSYRNYSPWIAKFVRKDDHQMIDGECAACGKKWCVQQNEHYYDRPFEALLDKGSKWTDIIGNGTRPFFTIVSQRILEIWESEGIGKFPAFPVTIIPPYKKMKEPPPMYWRLDSKKMIGCELDLEASGFIGAKYCEVCQMYSFDSSQSDRICDFKITPFVLKEGSWNGSHVFCTKYFGYMFCTEKVVDIAQKYKMTNFEFTPFEIAGSATSFDGVDYKVKDWRKKMAKQIEEFRKNFRSIDPVTRKYVE